MQKQLFMVSYESSMWLGGEDDVLVWALDEMQAKDLAAEHMQAHMRELFADEYNGYELEFGAEADETAYTVTEVAYFNEQHEDWKFYQTANYSEQYVLANFPVIGTPLY